MWQDFNSESQNVPIDPRMKALEQIEQGENKIQCIDRAIVHEEINPTVNNNIVEDLCLLLTLVYRKLAISRMSPVILNGKEAIKLYHC